MTVRFGHIADPRHTGLFDLSVDFPSIEPPPYLAQLSPDLYRQECERVQARFDEAIRLAEAAFLDELSKLVEHLTERLTGTEYGKPKIFRDSAVENLSEFFERFRHLNVRSKFSSTSSARSSRPSLRSDAENALRRSHRHFRL